MQTTTTETLNQQSPPSLLLSPLIPVGTEPMIPGVSRQPWKAATPSADEDPDPAGRSGTGGRKKGAWVRPWLKVDSAGQPEVVEAGKHSIMRRAGLPARDLRILDPLLSYPSTILGRERAIVVNLEHIKAVITAGEVLLLNYRDASGHAFVRELQRRLLHRHNRLLGGGEDEKEGGEGEGGDWSNVYDLEEPGSRKSSSVHSSAEDEKGKGGAVQDGPRLLPFEFIALEACLDSACSCLEDEAAKLEKEAHPALDKLTSKISTLNLERVRQIKSRLVAISGRVQKVRDELEHLLDDDDDMAEMYLTEKLAQQLLSRSSSCASHEQDNDLEEDKLTAEISVEENDIQNSYEVDSENIDNHERIFSGANVISGDSHGTHTFSTRSGSKHHDVEELEMLLEAYFVQIDSTLNKLSTLREYVDDTEDYINIMLDDKQNHLLQMGVVLTTATLVVSAFVALVGVFGMNIQVDLFDSNKAGMSQFMWTVGGGTTASVLLYIFSIAWCKRRRLLE